MDLQDVAREIKAALQRQNSNPTRFARENGFSVNSIRYIFEGRSPSAKRLQQICKALGLEFYVGLPRMVGGTQLNISQIATQLDRLANEARRMADSEAPPATTPVETSGLYASAPRYEVLAAAGTGVEVEDEVVTGHLGFNRKWLRDQGLSEDKLAVIEVHGDSMEPTLHERDIVLLDLQTSMLRDGRIYTLRRDNELLVKRLRRQGDNWLIVSDNLLYPVEPLDESITVLGRVVWLGRTLRDSA